jgi:hypothetical protein
MYISFWSVADRHFLCFPKESCANPVSTSEKASMTFTGADVYILQFSTVFGKFKTISCLPAKKCNFDWIDKKKPRLIKPKFFLPAVMLVSLSL